MLRFYRLIMILCCCLLAGCFNEKPEKLMIGTNIWPGYEPLYLAREKKFFNTNNIALVELSSASQVLRAFRNGVINAAALTLDETILLLASGEQVSIVLIFDVSNGGDVVLGQKNIKQLSDLKGKKIAVEAGALGAYVLLRALEKSNVSINNIDTVLTDYSQHQTVFTENSVDAIVTFEPIAGKLLNHGANLLFDSREIPGEIIDVLVVSNSYIEKNPNIVQQLINAWYRSLNYMENSPNDALTIINKRLNLSNDEARKAYSKLTLASPQLNQEYLQGSSKAHLLNTADKLSALMIKQHLLHSATDNQKLFDKNNFNHKVTKN